MEELPPASPISMAFVLAIAMLGVYLPTVER